MQLLKLMKLIYFLIDKNESDNERIKYKDVKMKYFEREKTEDKE